MLCWPHSFQTPPSHPALLWGTEGPGAAVLDPRQVKVAARAQWGQAVPGAQAPLEQTIASCKLPLPEACCRMAWGRG